MEDINWMAGGPQGAGVDTAANIFTLACGYGGLHVYGRREYHSNIKGKHSYFHVRVSPHEILANVNDVNVLAAFDAETVVTHMNEMPPGSVLIVDGDKIDADVLDIRPISPELREELREYLDSRGWGNNLRDILGELRKRGIIVFTVPYQEILGRVASKVGLDSAGKAARMTNVLTIGISFSILGYDEELVHKAIRANFSDKPKVAEMNIQAFDVAYRYGLENFKERFKHRLEKQDVGEERVLLQGHQSVALGKLMGGCRVQTYYPITPAADESVFLEAHEVFKTKGGQGSIVVFQAEDEISAVNSANGAVLAGARAATSTSGPGFSLMVEGLSWAGNNEVPVVITYYQRGAPSTGLPTRHGQDDLRFAIHAGHGEFGRIVLASGDIRECFHDAARAFDYAEEYQLPVIHLVDKALANSYQTYKLFDIDPYRIRRGDTPAEPDLSEGRYKRFKFTENGVSPRVFLGTKNSIHWYTGDEHDELGHVTEHPSTRTKMVEKRMKKMELIEGEVPLEEKINFYGDPKAENIVVSWGSPKGAVIESIGEMARDGLSIGFLQVRMVHPLPARQIGEILRRAEKVIDVEMNYSGQLGGLITEKTGVNMTSQILKYNGRPMTTTEVHGAVRGILTGESPKRQVLAYGA